MLSYCEILSIMINDYYYILLLLLLIYTLLLLLLKPYSANHRIIASLTRWKIHRVQKETNNEKNY